MSSKKNIVEIFNQQFNDLLKDLISIYPNLSQLKEYHTGLKVLLMTNKKFLIEIFKDYIYKYKDQIEKEDEKFFLDIDYSQYGDDNVTKQSKIFGEIWESKDTTNETKENIWLYFKLFMKLVDKYNE
jgi:hypothetical protein